MSNTTVTVCSNRTEKEPMDKSNEERVEELSKKLGGRFRLTVLVQKQMAQYIKGGRTFMPDVKNLDELFGYVLNEIEEGNVRLNLPGEEEGEEEEESGQLDG